MIVLILTIIRCSNHFIVFSAKISLDLKYSGHGKNLYYILKFFGIYIDLYLFMNFINAILLYNSAKCLPMHVRAPALKPPVTNAGILLHSPSHLSGLNLKGSLKYCSE